MMVKIVQNGLNGLQYDKAEIAIFEIPLVLLSVSSAYQDYDDA